MAQTNEQSSTCAGDCAGCPSATKCDDQRNVSTPKGLPPKVDISVKHVILVLSGKGGVGKSTVSANLAYSLANRGYSTGLIDLDIHGPNIPKMLGIEGARLQSYDGKVIEPVRVTGNLAVVSMAFLLPERNTPVIWRGPMKMAAIRQFLEDVNWGDLDYLVVDLPPGTGDEALTIAQLAPNIAGAVIVTTPQEVAILDSSKAIEFIKKLELPVLGIVENMSGFVCPHCKEEIDIFGKGGGEKEAKELGVPFLGSIPLDPEMRKAADEGRPFIIRRAAGENPTWKSIDTIMENLVKLVEE
ncbi:MAG TPA: Mrp/NBP35 family ATP-binding protein [Candidatus Methanoculleus thermohydrogenotrophicum]|jgi:ATP-binding protein involved in chromosome partitioning|nr:Mrp/NBP35 family ATP-binding protein [Candidatus Methanoculleus thermohydrogenotrophicum]NLM82042.1 Mrp/NBP35 family ATP-binding protein [Candidatus Methanoculleus thermohydrogenotrophicum]HOB17268.1 Mrp/NBP35 family ATP-binding protein [Candidatus Methanoculleus thermohydrogenotrophicum]HPZ37447.1 Mrp/NBP35 family ATP-binding protein [Candidatus Methanoculleus thermohydrogenotrophicum]HQC90876.1 Mrp/NBP35 family ATP-binding protein [Candidatus Methanoculleus thermohydrogenotrophicum]